MKAIITGGAGFIGSSRDLCRGDHVVVVNNLSREGVSKNLNWSATFNVLEAMWRQA
jgi:nucleoside-diphosphate-sugar epimerase